MGSIFADIKTPFVNELTLKRNLSPRVKENIFQGIILRPNEGCTEKFSTDTDAAEIQVIRIKPDDKQAREIGADVNGNYFNGDDAVQPNSEAYGIKILTTIDHNIDIPTNAQDMVNVDLAEAELRNLSGKVNRNINAITIAAQLCKNFNDIANDKIKNNWITLAATYTKGDYKNALLDANAKLDEGNEAQGIDLYPSDQRAIIIRPSIRSAFMREGELIIGGSNYAQSMLADGGLSPNAKRHDVNGFAGYIDGVPVYVASPVIFNLAAKYLDIDTKVMDGVMALVVSAIGTGRALAFNSEMKTIPCPAGQGIRLQPKYRMGAACWDGLSVVPVVANGFTNPATSSANLKVLAPGSRVAG
ncbi:MAG: hypothetical protein J1G02_06345 [Clostridiales bacterium]|nr:hypothetical protein [Clostridiales bacterium]